MHIVLDPSEAAAAAMATRDGDEDTEKAKTK
jgi:hypothetical protein